MFGGCAAAPADNVDPTIVGPFANHVGHGLWVQIELPHFVRQSSVGVRADERGCHFGQFFQVGTHDIRS